jgi:23S rRNA pseudouridine1911/1915/1917 synthase
MKTDNGKSEQGKVFVLEAGHPDEGQRLDRFLTLGLARRTSLEASRSRLKALIQDGAVSANGKTITEPSARVKPGVRYVLRLPALKPAKPVAQAIPLRIVYEDEDLIVVDKPAGLVIHPAPGNPDRTLVNALIAHCGESLSGIGGERRPGIVHRLDKDTSGLLVAAKNDAAHRALARQFAARTVERSYLALTYGRIDKASGEIRAAIGRDPGLRQRMAVRPDGKLGAKPALTHFKRRKFVGDATLLECRLKTGRTHQIRVHLSHIGHPVIGDPVYAQGRQGWRGLEPGPVKTAIANFRRQALHAQTLGFRHPRTGAMLSFVSPLPEDMADLIGKLEALAHREQS